MDRIVSQLLAELDGVKSGSNLSDDIVFVIGATNRPDLIDPALLRPGRFDRLVYLGIPSQVEEKIRILEALTRKFVLSNDEIDGKLNISDVVDLLPSDFPITGADLYAVAADSMGAALARRIRKEEERHGIDDSLGQLSGAIDTDDVEDSEQCTIVVNKSDFINAIKKLVPSVSKDDLMYYESLREKKIVPQKKKKKKKKKK